MKGPHTGNHKGHNRHHKIFCTSHFSKNRRDLTKLYKHLNSIAVNNSSAKIVEGSAPMVINPFIIPGFSWFRIFGQKKSSGLRPFKQRFLQRKGNCKKKGCVTCNEVNASLLFQSYYNFVALVGYSWMVFLCLKVCNGIVQLTLQKHPTGSLRNPVFFHRCHCIL